MSKPIDQERELFEKHLLACNEGWQPEHFVFADGEYENRFVNDYFSIWKARAAVQPAVVVVPEMPVTHDRRPYDDNDPDGYLEGNRDWAENNDEAVQWLADNHTAIRLALAAAPHPVSGEHRPKATEKDIERWQAAILAKPEGPWQMGNGGSFDRTNINPISDEMLEELALWLRMGYTPWNGSRLMPGDRQFMYLLFYSVQGLVSRMRVAERAAQDVAGLVEALEYYANGDHFLLADPDAWDTCSGEPQNWLHDDEGTASVEDGSVAKQALAVHRAQQGEQS